MSEIFETVKDTFSGTGKGGKKTALLWAGAAVAVIGLALYIRSRNGSDGIITAGEPGAAGANGSDGAAAASPDMSGVISAFGSEIDRIDARIANLGMTGTGYTTLTGTTPATDPGAAAYTDNMLSFAPMVDEPTITTEPNAPQTPVSVPAAGYPTVAAPTSNLFKPVAAAVMQPKSYAAAPASEKLVVAPKSVVTTNLPVSPELAAGMAKDPYLAARINAAKPMAQPVAAAKQKLVVSPELAAGMAKDPYLAARINAAKPMAQPVAAAKPVTPSPTVSAAKTDPNIAKAISATQPKPAAPKPVAAPAVAKSTAGAAITLTKPAPIPAPAKSPAITSQAAYNDYMRTR